MTFVYRFSLDKVPLATQDLINEHKENMSTLMLNAMHHCDVMMLGCFWQGKQYPCRDLFSVRPTDDGFCCSFNTLSIPEQL